VSYLNEEKINLSPAFQRGHVWNLTTRRKLVRNIVLGKPIPAIFLYKEAVGSKYSYNILDGKQRLESLILFIADNRPDLRVDNWARYFFGSDHQKAARFGVELPMKRRTFTQLNDEEVRDFREYSIPTIEISLEEDTSLDEVITLFVDINQQGEPVKRFDIVKALYRSDPVLKGVFGLLALEQRRGQDVFYKPKANEFTSVLKRLQVVDSISASNAKVDKMWEKLLELAIFARSNEHRNPVAILKEFITPALNKPKTPKLSSAEIARLRGVFRFLKSLLPAMKGSRFFTDQTHSYTMVTSVLRGNLLTVIGEEAFAIKLQRFSALLDDDKKAGTNRKLVARLREYRELSTKQTTHVSRRDAREMEFIGILNSL
jgi:hypothetical protein